MNGRFPWPVQYEATLTFSVVGMDHNVVCFMLIVSFNLFGCLPSIQFGDIQFILLHLLYFLLDLYLYLNLISSLPARTLRLFHLSPPPAHHPLYPSVSCIYYTYITHTFLMCDSFLDHFTLEMEAVWSSKMSGTTPSDKLSHWRRLESSARSVWEPQIYK